MRNLFWALVAGIFLLSCETDNTDAPKETGPPVIGTAQFGDETVYFITSMFRPRDERWGTGVRISLNGYTAVRWPGELWAADGDYVMHFRFPYADADVEYVDIDVAELESLKIAVPGTRTEPNDYGYEELEVASGTFTFKKVVRDDDLLRLSFDLVMSDGKIFEGGATINKKGGRLVRPN